MESVVSLGVYGGKRARSLTLVGPVAPRAWMDAKVSSMLVLFLSHSQLSIRTLFPVPSVMGQKRKAWLLFKTTPELMAQWKNQTTQLDCKQVFVFFFFLIYHFNYFKNFIYLFIWPRCTACEILLPWSEIKPTPLALKAWSFNLCTTREEPCKQILTSQSSVFPQIRSHFSMVGRYQANLG